MMKQVFINPMLRQLHRNTQRNVLQAYASSRMSSTGNRAPSPPSPGKSLVLQDNNKKVISPWVAKSDPQGSQLTYFWNTETNETTALGSPKPYHWVEVRDPAGSELTYWWNVDNNQTTALGAPRPGVYDNTGMAVYQQRAPFGYVNQGPPMTLGQSMKTYFALGLGMSIAFAAVRALFS